MKRQFLYTASTNSQKKFGKSSLFKADRPQLSGIYIGGKAPLIYYPLTQNAEKQTRFIETQKEFDIGDWVEIISDKIFDHVPNSKSAKTGLLRKIIHKSKTKDNNFKYELHHFLNYDFLRWQNAKVGKPTIIENVIIEDPIIQPESHYFIFGIYLQYAVNVKIINPWVSGTKRPHSNDIPGASAIKIGNCYNVDIIDPTLNHIGWYGIELHGCTENIYVEQGKGFDCRHSISVNWSQENGCPHNIHIYGMTAQDNTLSSFDTHDVGSEIVFEDCKSYNAGDDGFQFRTPKVIARNCLSYGSFLDGFSTEFGADNCLFENCNAEFNNRKNFYFKSSGNQII